MITSRLLETFILVFLTLTVEITADINFRRSRYSPVLRNIYSNICPKPEFVNGLIRMRLRGKYLRFECDADFTLVGSSLLLCKNGKWNSPVPICVKSGCVDLAAVDNGFILYENEKAAATLFCDGGYKLAGSMYSYCNGSSWDRLLGSCRPTGMAVAVSCDFEVDDLCGWENEATHSVDWERSSGVASRRALKTGPKHDHTTGEPLNGHFMMVDSSQQNPNSTARLISPIYNRNYSTVASFRFFYHMFGDVGTLAVYVKPLILSLREMLKQTAQFSVSGNQGNAWIEGCLDVEQQNESFQFVIQASLGMRYRSDIAIDDVQLLNGSGCNTNDTILETITESDDDIIRIDSCVGRCGKNMSDSSGENNQNVIHCGCNNDCNDDNPCCPDYAEICVFDGSTVAEEDVNLETDMLGWDTQQNSKVTDSTSIVLGVLGTVFFLSSIIMAVICFCQVSRFQVLSVIRRWRSNHPEDAYTMAEDVHFLSANDTLSDFSEDFGSSVTVRSS
ncbi:MAM and LDL-receptor class A domain-containing protein 2-like [Armigeres subalbatus]|uniref:MAM and LDL-receptor class A domain-containing protein 2-like n=1 Tax=Armigeres subalbatus TaxID=124917 RepID=UPI002ED10A4E